MANYTVFDNGQVRHGNAEQILDQIRASVAGQNEEIAAMDVRQYAGALIEDAPYFLEPALLEQVEKQQFENDFERALSCLTLMPTSGVRILRAA